MAAIATIAAPVFAGASARAQTYTLSTLAAFNGAGNGEYPYAGVTLDSSGNLYGTTSAGGASNDGTVFKIAAGTNTLTTLATFTGAGNGASPYGNVAFDAAGDLYGTTYGGGTNNDGTVFEIASGTSTLTTLATFNGTGNGKLPNAGVTLDGSGNLYGTTYEGGADNQGTVFKVAVGTNTLATLVTLTGSATGSGPTAGLTRDGSGNLYGTTFYGGANGDGTVFEIAAGTSTVTTLATFAGANGAKPYGGITLDSSGNLYGTTFAGGTAGDGTVFKIAAGTDTLTTLATFFGVANGAEPSATMVLDGGGNLYGTTTTGGADGDGTVFKVAAGTNSLTTLATFTGTGNGTAPETGLTLDSRGNLYGTTSAGGANSYGTVFELSPTGSAVTPEPGSLALLLPLALGAIAKVARRARADSPS